MFAVLYAVWFIFNGRVTGEIALIGAPICAAIYLFAWKFLDVSPKNEWRVVKRIFGFTAYFALLLKEIFVANTAVLKLILNPRIIIEPKIVTFEPKLNSDSLRTLLADSITLTPGTITVDMQGSRLTVHCLDTSLAADLENSTLEKRLQKLEVKA